MCVLLCVRVRVPVGESMHPLTSSPHAPLQDITDLFPELLSGLSQVDDYALPLPPLDMDGEGLLSQSTGLATTSSVFHTVSELSLNEGGLQRLVNWEERAVAQSSEEGGEEGAWCLTAVLHDTLMLYT